MNKSISILIFSGCLCIFSIFLWMFMNPTTHIESVSEIPEYKNVSVVEYQVYEHVPREYANVKFKTSDAPDIVVDFYENLLPRYGWHQSTKESEDTLEFTLYTNNSKVCPFNSTSALFSFCLARGDLEIFRLEIKISPNTNNQTEVSIEKVHAKTDVGKNQYRPPLK